MTISSQEEVVRLITKIKLLLVNNKYDFVPRKVNMEALTELGWTIDYFLKII